MTWHQISIVTQECSAGEIADFFSSVGAVSVTYMDAEDQPVYEPAIGETKIWPNTQVIALFEIDADTESIKSSLFSHYPFGQIHSWRHEELADQEWERAWMAYYQPMKFGKTLWVCPSGQERYEAGTVCLTLDPGLAFGTGTHPTTALCLEWLADQDLTGKVIIDFGCGSGILAIAALLLGANFAYAIDIDPQALTASQGNAEKNRVEDRLCCLYPDQFSGEKADIVLANILAKPLIELSRPLSGMLNSNGQLVLSGILAEQAESVAEAYLDFVRLNEPAQQEEWIRLDGAKK